MCAELFILLLDLLINFFQLIDSRSIQHIFNVAKEESLGTWFSVVQAAIAGIVLAGLYYISNDGQRRTWGWLILALFFIYMSADDAAKIHERMGSFIERETSADGGSIMGKIGEFFPSYAWQWVFAPFFLSMGLYILFFLWTQLSEIRLRLIVIVAFGCWATAVGIDFIEGREGFFEGIAESLAVKEYTVSHPFLMTEEFLEMFGTSLFLYVFIIQFVECLNRRIASPGLHLPKN